MGSTYSHESLQSSNFQPTAEAVECCAPLSHPHTITTAEAVDEAEPQLEPVVCKSARPESRKRKAQNHSLGTAPETKKRKTIGKGKATKATKASQATKTKIDKMAAAVDEPVDYRDLKEWIAEQEALPQPPPLTDVQRKAIAELKASVRRKIPEPEVGGTDWISLLHRYRDAHKAVGAEVSFNVKAAHNGQWTCSCTFRGTDYAESMKFPGVGAGFVTVDAKGTLVAPSFARKKDAKQYAAKCCVDWLMAESYMPRGGVNVVFERSRAKPFPSAGQQAAGSSCGPTAPVSSTSTPGETSSDDSLDEGVPATEQVRDLCKYLHFAVPQYRLNLVGNSLYNGFADFGADAVNFPDTIGRVTNCYTKDLAKERIAEDVRKHLLEIKAGRLATIKAVLGDGALLD